MRCMGKEPRKTVGGPRMPLGGCSTAARPVLRLIDVTFHGLVPSAYSA